MAKTIQFKDSSTKENVYPTISMDSTIVDGSETKYIKDVINDSSVDVTVPLANDDGTVQYVDVNKHPIFDVVSYSKLNNSLKIGPTIRSYAGTMVKNASLYIDGYVDCDASAFNKIGYNISGEQSLGDILNRIMHTICVKRYTIDASNKFLGISDDLNPSLYIDKGRIHLDASLNEYLTGYSENAEISYIIESMIKKIKDIEESISTNSSII